MAFDKKPKRHKPSNIDLEEIRPHQFYVHEVHARAILKGEGTFKGQVFELTSWRRDGLMGRLREQGYVVRTLADQVDRLPRMPHPVPIGPEVLRPLVNTIERFSYFDALALTWVPVEPQPRVGEKEQVVTLRAGWVVRRRRGRGAPSFYEVFKERTGGAGLRVLDESKALLAGYAQATALRDRDLVARHIGKAYLLPDVALPIAYIEVLGRLAEQMPDGWRVHERGWPLIQELFARLGLLLRGVEEERENTRQGERETDRLKDKESGKRKS